MIQTIAISDIPFFGENVEITNLAWNFDEAVIDVYCPKEKKEIKVRFDNQFGPCALRLLDEADLSENWQNINMSGGWLYKVESGGWFEQESQRDGFLMQHSSNIYKEYLILGLDACVSVFTKEDVAIIDGSEEVAKIST
ncbi:hypothetical protein [Neptunicella sp. SCSIO 80796]|uniref:hypothetical protein n=1 Tax=Neptunicella plasticusilytica TaxID=3117012 RepID=UPI003A4D3040